MPVEVTITPRKDLMDRARRELAHINNGANRAMSAAINKTATGAKTDTVRLLIKHYTAQQKAIRHAISIGKRASPANLQATVLGRYQLIPLIDFNVKPKRVTKRRPAGGLLAEVKRGESKKLPHSFIATLGGKPQVASRVGKRRLPIKRLFGPSVPQMMDNEDIAEQVLELAADRLDKYLDHEISRIEKGYGG